MLVVAILVSSIDSIRSPSPLEGLLTLTDGGGA